MRPLIREVNKKYIEVIGHYDDPILCAKMTLLADLYAVEHKEGYALFKVEDYDKLAKIDSNLEFSVTDLTGTTWLINEYPLISMSGTFHVNFTAKNVDYIDLVFYQTRQGLKYGTSWAFDEEGHGGWIDDTIAFRTISITGGTDTANSNLIAWLEANAIQIPTDLTGYTWVAGSSYDFVMPSITETYNINFKSDDTDFTSFGIGKADGKNIILYDGSTALYASTWIQDGYNTIVINGGTDVTNLNLISWLATYGTLTAPEPQESNKIFFGNSSISKIALGNSEVSKIFLGSVEIYSKTTSNGYQVTVQCLGGTGTLYDGQDSSGILLGTISYDETKTYTITSGYIYCSTYGYFFGSGLNPLQITSDETVQLNSGGSND